MSEPPFRYLFLDGDQLSLDESARGRRFGADRRCFMGAPMQAYAHVCAQEDPDARLPFDAPEVQQARRDALAWWIPMLGDDLVCLTTLSIDAVNYGGAITVCREWRRLGDDPFARLFPGRVLETDLFSQAEPPPGPVMERYGGAPWPGGSF